MLGLTLIACHLLGDFVLQTRWQSERKFGFSSADAFGYRTKHVLTYCIPFVAPAILFADDLMHAAAFLALLYVLHFLTDTRRFRSTLGDVLAWLNSDRREVEMAVGDPMLYRQGDHIKIVDTDWRGTVIEKYLDTLVVRLRLPDNPWPPIAILIDQTLHIAQLAALGWLLT